MTFVLRDTRKLLSLAVVRFKKNATKGAPPSCFCFFSSENVSKVVRHKVDTREMFGYYLFIFCLISFLAATRPQFCPCIDRRVAENFSIGATSDGWCHYSTGPISPLCRMSSCNVCTGPCLFILESRTSRCWRHVPTPWFFRASCVADQQNSLLPFAGILVDVRKMARSKLSFFTCAWCRKLLEFLIALLCYFFSFREILLTPAMY